MPYSCGLKSKFQTMELQDSSFLMQAPPTNLERPVSLGNSLYVCGDHREAATLEGALRSGLRAADAVLTGQ